MLAVALPQSWLDSVFLIQLLCPARDPQLSASERPGLPKHGTPRVETDQRAALAWDWKVKVLWRWCIPPPPCLSLPLNTQLPHPPLTQLELSPSGRLGPRGTGNRFLPVSKENSRLKQDPKQEEPSARSLKRSPRHHNHCHGAARRAPPVRVPAAAHACADQDQPVPVRPARPAACGG